MRSILRAAAAALAGTMAIALPNGRAEEPKQERAQAMEANNAWTPLAQLSENGAVGSPGGTHPISTDGNTVHVVWEQGGKIHYRRSKDKGVTWEKAVEVTSGASAQCPCSLELSASALHLFWPDGRNSGRLGGNLGETYCKRSTDGGNSWSSEARVSPGMNFFRFGTAISGSAIHLAWNEQGDRIPNAANYRWYKGTIYYKHSIDGGNTWGPDIALTPKNDFDHGRPAIAASGQYVHVAWIDGRDAQRDMPWDNDIYYSRSTDGGLTWGPNVRMNNDPGERAWHPQILATSTGQVCLIHEFGAKFDPATKTWSGDSALYAKVSLDNGQTWGQSGRITFVHEPKEWATHCKAYISGSRIHLAWTDVPETGQPQKPSAVYYTTSPDGGLTWEHSELITTAAEGQCWAAAVAGTDSYAVVLVNRGQVLSYRRRNLVELAAGSNSEPAKP